MLIKKIFSIITKNFFFIKILNPVKKIVNGIKIEVSPMLWKKMSDTKLPLDPKIFFISVFSGNIKFGSSGE